MDLERGALGEGVLGRRARLRRTWRGRRRRVLRLLDELGVAEAGHVPGFSIASPSWTRCSSSTATSVPLALRSPARNLTGIALRSRQIARISGIGSIGLGGSAGLRPKVL